MKLWIDDNREAPLGWVPARTLFEALAYLSSGQVTHASFGDSDLSYPIVCWLTSQVANRATTTEKLVELHVHTPIVAERKQIADTIEKLCSGFPPRRV